MPRVGLGVIEMERCSFCGGVVVYAEDVEEGIVYKICVVCDAVYGVYGLGE